MTMSAALISPPPQRRSRAVDRQTERQQDGRIVEPRVDAEHQLAALLQREDHRRSDIPPAAKYRSRAPEGRAGNCRRIPRLSRPERSARAAARGRRSGSCGFPAAARRESAGRRRRSRRARKRRPGRFRSPAHERSGARCARRSGRVRAWAWVMAALGGGDFLAARGDQPGLDLPLRLGEVRLVAVEREFGLVAGGHRGRALGQQRRPAGHNRSATAPAPPWRDSTAA